MKIGITFGLFLLLLALFAELQDVNACKLNYCTNAKGLKHFKNTLRKGGKNVKPKKINCDEVVTFEQKGKRSYQIPRGVKSIDLIEARIEKGADVFIGPIFCKGAKRPCKMMRLRKGVETPIDDIKLPRKRMKILIIESKRSVSTIRFVCERKCALMKKTDAERIVRGGVAVAHEFPFMAYLDISFAAFFENDTFAFNDTTFCGGSIISEEWILTAAHCLVDRDAKINKTNFPVTVYKVKPFKVTVLLGKHDLSKKEKCQLKRVVPKADFVIHAGFDHVDGSCDIALLKMEPVRMKKDNIFPICLPPYNMNPYKLKCDVQAAGWGLTLLDPTPDLLHKGNFRIVRNAVCPVRGRKGLCYLHKRTNTCYGDSGGPVFYKSSSNMYYQLGVVSYSNGKVAAPVYWLPGSGQVASDVILLRPWILAKIGGGAGGAAGGAGGAAGVLP